MPAASDSHTSVRNGSRANCFTACRIAATNCAASSARVRATPTTANSLREEPAGRRASRAREELALRQVARGAEDRRARRIRPAPDAKALRRRVRQPCGATRAADDAQPCRSMPPSSSSNESANFCTPSCLERRDHVVVVDAGRGELVEQRVRLRRRPSSSVSRDLAVVLERPHRLERHRVDGVAARSAPRRRARRGRRGSSSRSTPRGSAACARPCACSASQRVAREDLLLVLRRRASRSRPRACPAGRRGPTSSSRWSASVSTRETKKLATEMHRSRVAARRDEPLEPAQVRLGDRARSAPARRSA